MMRVAGLAGAAAACVMSACVMPLAEDRADAFREVRAEGRERAARHAQLSLAYLRHARADVAHTEALAAWRLAPEDVGIVHLLALSEASLGQSEAALRLFARAVKLDDARRSDEGDGGVDIPASDFTTFAGGQASRGRVLQDRVRELSLSAAQDGIKELSERAILWSNYAVALEAVGEHERAACFVERARDSRSGAGAGRPCLE